MGWYGEGEGYGVGGEVGGLDGVSGEEVCVRNGGREGM